MLRGGRQALSSHIHLQRRDKRLLRDVDLAELPHALYQQFSEGPMDDEEISVISEHHGYCIN
ncbi:MAG TPA: hypothetical protein VJZ74_07205, partial [Pseudolabrys sp.]|nr:hypothetical protein [Pseudolabrys sp.]